MGDCWIVKLTSSGTIDWQKVLGGSKTDVGNDVQQTTDGGYIVAGYAISNDGDVIGDLGESCWILKLNHSGILQWQKFLGKSYFANSIRQTTDGGLIVAGSSAYQDSDVTLNHGSSDYWVAKLNDTGEIQWQKSLGGSSTEGAKCIYPANDGGYIVAGTSNSNDGDVTGNFGESSIWIVKLNDTGAIQWQKCFGDGHAKASSIQQTFDSGYIIVGSVQFNGHDITGYKGGFSDYWVVKLPYCSPINCSIINNSGLLSTSMTYSSYQWFLNGVEIPGATNSTFIINTPGYYAVSVTDTIPNSCSGFACYSYNVAKLNIETPSIDSVSINPNPTNGPIITTGITNPKVKIYNTLGQLVQTNANTNNISISELPSGLYFIMVFNEHGDLVKVAKVVKIQE